MNEVASMTTAQVIKAQNLSHLVHHHTRDPSWVAQKERGALLVVDIRGVIVACNKSAARLLKRSLDLIVGQSVFDLILDLPFAIDTPYYNLAYAVFHANQNFEMKRMALADNGMHFPINVTVSSVLIKGRRLISLSLKASKLVKESSV